MHIVSSRGHLMTSCIKQMSQSFDRMRTSTPDQRRVCTAMDFRLMVLRGVCETRLLLNQNRKNYLLSFRCSMVRFILFIFFYLLSLLSSFFSLSSLSSLSSSSSSSSLSFSSPLMFLTIFILFLSSLLLLILYYYYYYLVAATTQGVSKARKAEQYGAKGAYECPCYLYARRTDLYYIFIVDLPPGKNHSPTHWILRGVALLCNTEC